MKKAVIYCRVSSKEQVENLSLQTQEKQCREYCECKGYQVDRVFIEEGESAKTTNRPQLQELLEHCEKNKGSIGCVVVYSLSRLSRNLHDYQELRNFLDRNNVTLRSVTEPFDESPISRVMRGIFAAFAQYDHDLRSDQIRRGMREAAARRRTQNPNQG